MCAALCGKLERFFYFFNLILNYFFFFWWSHQAKRSRISTVILYQWTVPQRYGRGLHLFMPPLQELSCRKQRWLWWNLCRLLHTDFVNNSSSCHYRKIFFWSPQAVNWITAACFIFKRAFIVHTFEHLQLTPVCAKLITIKCDSDTVHGVGVEHQFNTAAPQIQWVISQGNLAVGTK